MKVVLFCGGKGLRLREFGEETPKPMVPIGPRPIIWHLMKYYAHFGHKDFILCLGWQGHVIKDYFLNYNECVSNDFVLKQGDRVQLLRSDISDWTITFADTGLHSNLGQRLTAVRPYLEGEECFLANYSDGVTDFHLPALIDRFHQSDSIATFLGVRPRQSFHLMDTDDDGWVSRMTPIATRQSVDERRLLCVPARDILIYPTRRRVGRRTIPAPHRRTSPFIAQVRRLLGLHGHL